MKEILSPFPGRKRRIYTLMLLIAAGYALPGYAGQKLHVLFLGNSYTHVNNMPQILSDMASAAGDTLIFEMYAPGGYAIDNHSEDTASENRIKKGGWDYLVLQEQSQLPSSPTYFSNGLYGLCYLFRLYNPCGRIMFYMTWGRKNGDAANCPQWPPVCTYQGMDSLLRIRYTQMAIDNQAELSPAGAAWRYTRQNNPDINLYDPDESHPSAAGSYLVACTFYTTLFKKDPTSINYNFTLSTANADTLKQAAKTVVFDSLSFWDHAPAIPVTAFNYTMGSGTHEVNFRNQSLFADSYLWDFGDGTTSTPYPVHSYSNDGTYTITLHAYNCDIDTIYEGIHQMNVTFCPFTPTITPQELTLCPGASDTLSTQLYDAYQWYNEDDNAVPGAIARHLVVSGDHRYYVEATLNGCTERSVPAAVAIASAIYPWLIVPAGKLSGADSACIGDTIALTVVFNKPPATDDSLIDWHFNGRPVAGYHNDTLLITQPGIYEATIRHDRCPSFDQTKQINFAFVPCEPDTAGVQVKSFIVAPNPVQDILSLFSPAFLSASYSIILVNQLGQIMHRQQSNGAARQYLDVSPYASGIYFISVIKDGTAIYRDKILKR